MIHETANVSPSPTSMRLRTLALGWLSKPLRLSDPTSMWAKALGLVPTQRCSGNTTAGRDCKFFPGCVVGADSQDLKYNGEPTTVEIGDRTSIRECVTIHRATTDRMVTRVGSDCLIMAYVHIAHDVQVGNHVILANACNVAGHVVIEDQVIIEGMVGIQQFVRIGKHAFIAGGSLVPKRSAVHQGRA